MQASHRSPQEPFMNLHISLPWKRAAPVRRTRPVAPDWVTATVCAAPTEDPHDKRCGWFDSSQDLTVGLRVTEHLSPDPVANEVPLGWWLDWQSQPVLRSVPDIPTLR
jgi:hypothetical protein